MAGGSSQPGRSVTSKILAILAAFETTRRSLSLTEISAAADLPLSTTHRLVGELVDAGMLSRSANGGIQLGLRLWAIAQNTGRQLRDTARPYVQDLFSLTGETSQLAIRDGNMSLYIDRVYGTKRIARASRVGGRLPLHATAVGKVILAFSESWVADAYLELPLQQMTAHTRSNPKQLREELERVREKGYATTNEEVRLGTSSIAVPVFHTGRLGCSIGLVIPTSHAANMDRFLPVLQGTSRRLEAATVHIPLETLLGIVSGPDMNVPEEDPSEEG
ncbi:MULTISPECIES: IclR family transcriptional regulator [Glutamicibacter]|uniref:IclR family transcriptional regulator n=1 Tax=Glutamicibacter mysorens TaxID=257984 RepID=A0ABX4N0B2_9MICC|nr:MULTISPECIES: IclR family transcriptional regulator [Glutamicibacter]KWR69982.1 IclR family transcriptional regulator [Arthrobacter sp. W1]MDV2978501.1 IclR family transcriptional regulator [Actinomycetes bacterium ARC8]PJJ45260.1 IclR family transcriptional regulator [Glutamicibacter mysorens]QEP08564.1 IclR family transcriptional regulator [Glutamicibacter sp. ZJUTW]